MLEISCHGSNVRSHILIVAFSVLVDLSSRDLDEDCFDFVNMCLVASEEKVESAGYALCYPRWLSDNLIEKGFLHDGQLLVTQCAV